MQFAAKCPDGRLAQLVERLLYTQDVGGSIPSPPTNCRRSVLLRIAFVALISLAGAGCAEDVPPFKGPVESGRVIRHGPIITADMLPGSDGKNINGPSLIRVPDWLPERLGRYYLYFAHHNGKYIRLAYADSITGPWKVHEPGSLPLESVPLLRGQIASPDVHVDDANRRLVMYFHGRNTNGDAEYSLVATSKNGIDFDPASGALGPAYARVFVHDGWYYGIFGAANQRVYRTSDWLGNWQSGPVLFPRHREAPYARHAAVCKAGEEAEIYFTRKSDEPERVLMGRIDLRKPWSEWSVTDEVELLRPSYPFEGSDRPLQKSLLGPAKERMHEVRDPAVFVEDGRAWLIYAFAGESGLALAEIKGACGTGHAN
jgi:hypothetical protein